MFEVDVFDHPRFCDEFSHLMNRTFLASASLSLSLSCIQLIVSHLLKVLEDRQTYSIALKENFELLTSV